jgi:hypothetical protein
MSAVDARVCQGVPDTAEIHAHIHTHTHTHARTRTLTHTHTGSLTHSHTYIKTHTHWLTQTHTHTHTHTHTGSLPPHIRTIHYTTDFRSDNIRGSKPQMRWLLYNHRDSR